MIHLIQVSKTEQVEVQEVKRIPVPGIFDMKWFVTFCGEINRRYQNLLAVASATGKVDIFRLQGENSWEIEPQNSSPEEGSMSLSVAWSADGNVASSYSSGRMSVIKN